MLALEGSNPVPQLVTRQCDAALPYYNNSSPRLSLQAVNDDEVEGGPDDDDFRPCPDRACSPVVRLFALYPMSTFCIGITTEHVLPPSVALVGAGLIPASHFGVAAAVETSVQFLC